METTLLKLQVAVKAFIINDEGKVLLLEKNIENRPEYPSKWDIPGGRIDPGANLRTNLEREIYEETGLRVVGPDKLIFAQDIIRETFHIVRLTYVLRATGVISLSEEHTAYEWFTYDELIALESVDECIREVLDNVPPTFASSI
jgi:8-oxo-dGTP diphosphatase